MSSAGESKIRIFNSQHNELLPSISNANQPCGLAVDSKGNLYVSELTTGEVIKYHPNAYPFSGAPSYAAPAVVDSSGEAKGIAVDRTSDRLYIAEGDRVLTYRSDGSRGEDERQQLVPPASGTYTLTFEGQTTSSLSAAATSGEVQEALESLSTIGSGNVVVENTLPGFGGYAMRFVGTLGSTDVAAISTSNGVVVQRVQGFNGLIGQGVLTAAAGTAAVSPQWRIGPGKLTMASVFAADSTTGNIQVFSSAVRQEFGGEIFSGFDLRKTIDGSETPHGSFGFESIGAQLTADPGNQNAEDPDEACLSVAQQACTAGHVMVFDSTHDVVDEYDASGEFIDQLPSEGLTGAGPSGIAIDRSGGENDGAIYVGSGPGPGAKLLTFAPLSSPSRPALPPPLSKTEPTARAVAVDTHGYIYLAVGPFVHVFDPQGKEVTSFSTEKAPFDLGVDGAGNVYALENINNGNRALEKVQYYSPSSFPPTPGTSYAAPVKAADGNSFVPAGTPLVAIGVNPSNGHLFVANQSEVIELGAGSAGSPILNPCFACDIGAIQSPLDVAADGVSGSVYIADLSGRTFVFDPTGSALLGRVTGAGSILGAYKEGVPAGKLAVDQENGHVVTFSKDRGRTEEYDASGGFVTAFGEFTTGLSRTSGVAIDNSGGSSDDNVYIAFDDTAANTPDLWAFGPLSYGAPPDAETGSADHIVGGSTVLHGTVNPTGFVVDDCHFDYIPDSQYVENGKSFTPGATSVPCAETPAEIGHGNKAVEVHADVSGLVSEGRYRFRLMAGNKFGSDDGGPRLFGPPAVDVESVLPILYNEVTLRAKIDPAGLATAYHFDYGTTGAYGQSTPTKVLAGTSNGPVQIEVPVTGLAEGTEYQFRLVAENEVKAVEEAGQAFETLERRGAEACSNTEYRVGLSANLPDCRAYELVTPTAAIPGSPTAGGREFNNWLVPPHGSAEGSVAYASAPIPGFEGGGEADSFRALRGEAAHPANGWQSEIIAPSYAQVGLDGGAQQHSMSSDQRYWFFTVAGTSEAFEETLPLGFYLRVPNGMVDPQCNPIPLQDDFEYIGCGTLGTDPEAEGRYLSEGGVHTIFDSKDHLEPSAPPAGTTAIYDRKGGSGSSAVISTRPDGSAFGSGENASYVASTEDGKTVVFEVGGDLYVHRGGETVEVAEDPNTFAGISSDGGRVFFADQVFAGGSSSGAKPAGLFMCDVDLGPCAGASAQATTAIADEAIFVNVSDDGSHAFFITKDALTGSEENENGEEAEDEAINLYSWDGGIHFIARLDTQDLVGFGGQLPENLTRWTVAINAGPTIGRSYAPTRSTPDGRVLVFQSHAQLTPYGNKGKGEVYRYDPESTVGPVLSCVSCDPSGAPPSADALLQNDAGGVTRPTVMIPNVTDDGQEVFFHSPDRLLPEDANDVIDVYEWKAAGVSGCKRLRGCLALISSGQGERATSLYSMSTNGDDVFIQTWEKLVGADVPDFPSIYDARVNGGIPDPPTPAPCQGDACQGQGSTPPVLATPGSIAGSGEEGVAVSGKCVKANGKRSARSKAKKRCGQKHRARHTHKSKSGNHHRGGSSK